MAIRGIAAGPEQVADGTNINQLASVDTAGSIANNLTKIGGKDAGLVFSRPLDVNLQILITLRAILRVLTEQNAFERGMMDDPDALLADEDASLGIDGAA